MLKLSLLLGSVLALSGYAVVSAEPADSDAQERDAEPTGSDAEPLGGRTYWDIPGCHTYAWMKNHGTWLCAIHGEIQIMFDPRHQSCAKDLYGSFWHQCAYQI